MSLPVNQGEDFNEGCLGSFLARGLSLGDGGQAEQVGRAGVGGPDEPLNTLTGQRTPLSLQAGWQAGRVLPVLSSGALPLPPCCVMVGKAPNLSVLLFLQL